MAGSRPDGAEGPPALDGEEGDRESTTVVTTPLDLEDAAEPPGVPSPPVAATPAAPVAFAPSETGGSAGDVRRHLAELMPGLAVTPSEESEGDGVTVRRDISAFVAAMEANRRDPSVEVLPPAVPVGASTLTPVPPAAAEPALAAALAALPNMALPAPRPGAQAPPGAAAPAAAAAPTPQTTDPTAEVRTAREDTRKPTPEGLAPPVEPATTPAPSGPAAPATDTDPEPAPEPKPPAHAGQPPSEQNTLVTAFPHRVSVPAPDARSPSDRDPGAPAPTRPTVAAVPAAAVDSPPAAPAPTGPAAAAAPAAASTELALEEAITRPRRGRTIGVFALGALVGAAGALGVGAIVLPRYAAPAPVASEPVTSASSASASSPVPPSLAERARGGDPAALAELDSKKEAERSVAEAVALIEGRGTAARGRITELGARLRKDPTKLEEATVRQEVWELLSEPRTATQALAIVAEIPGPLAPDILFRVWTTTSARTDTTELAEMLLFSHQVRSRASPALAVALDLRRTSDCEAVRALLPRAAADGDARSTRPLALVALKTGCGPNKRSDCFRCLRQDPAPLDHAIRATRVRAAPKFP